MANQLKIGIVGMGNAGMMHANSIIGGAISNAILLSTWTDGWVSLPVDAELFETELQRRIAGSKRKSKKGNSIILDLKDSFK